ncbi:MAG: pur operon repressor [Eubacterium sp.]
MKRTERVGAMIKILTDTPSRVYPLQYFCDLFGAAKSSVSEDLQAASRAVESTGTGKIETIAGAHGGARFVPDISDKAASDLQEEFCRKISDPGRILTGGFLYTSDLMFDPVFAGRVADVFVRAFRDCGADCVATVETKGIPLALAVSEKLALPLIVIRREAKVSDGSTVSINYFSGSYDRIQKMSVARRAVTPGAKALIIDDFMRGGGSIKGITDILAEFDATVAGVGVAIASVLPERKKIENYTAVIFLGNVDEENKTIEAYPNKNVFSGR